MPLDGLAPVGVPGVVGPCVSAGGPVTVIDAETPLIELGLLNESTASTVYVWLVPGVRPGSVKLVDVVDTDRGRVAVTVDPVRDRRRGIGGCLHWIWIMPLDGLEPVGVPGVVGPWVSAGGPLTVIEAEAPLIRLGLLSESTASTV